MKFSDINKTYRRAKSYIASKAYVLAMEDLRVLSSQLGQWWAFERSEELESLCRNIVQYSVTTNVDEEIETDFFIRVNAFADDVYSQLRLINSSGYINEQYKLSKNTSLEQVQNDVEQLIAMCDADLFDTDTEEAFHRVFNAIWMLGANAETELKAALKRLFTAPLPSYLIVALIGAAQLNLTNRYDALLYSFVTNSQKHGDVEVRAAAYVALMFIHASLEYLPHPQFPDKIELYSTAALSFSSSRISDEISDFLNKSLKNKNIDALALNKGIDILKADNSELLDAVYKISDLQLKGVDTYLRPFSQLKGYPFFFKPANWFLPFTKAQIDIAKASNITAPLIDLLYSQSTICSSDKYSIFFTMHSVPRSAIDSMLSSMGIENMDAKEESAGETWKADTIEELNNKIRTRIFDNYRFYKLFYQHTQITDAFQLLEQHFDDSQNVSELEAEKTFKILYYSNRYDLVLKYGEILSKPSFELYSLLGTAAEHENSVVAIDYYKKALLFKDDDVSTYQKIAQIYSQSQNHFSAIEYLNKGLEQDVENVDIMIELMNQYSLAGNTEAALAVGNALKYYAPERVEAYRIEAKACLDNKRAEDAVKLYRKTIELCQSSDDLYYLAVAYLCCADVNNAVDCFLRYLQACDSTKDFIERFFNDVPLFNKYNINTLKAKMIANQIVLMHTNINSNNI